MSGAIEVPAYILCFWGMDGIGRRATVIVCLMGICACTAIELVPLLSTRRVPTLMVWMSGVLAKGFISAGFSCAYCWCAELFPAPVRGRAMGSCSAAARLGSMCAPIVVVALVEFHESIPALVFGALSFLTAIATTQLQESADETNGQPREEEATTILQEQEQKILLEAVEAATS